MRTPETQSSFTAPEAPTAPPTGSGLRSLFAFPNPVNEYAARITAGLVVLVAVPALATGSQWAVGLIAAGFWLRVLFGPRVSPLAVLSVKVLAPLLGRTKPVPGPPKRFAQGIGAFLSTAAAVLLALGAAPVAWALVAVLIVAASLEACAGFCLGCRIFAVLQDRGLIPEDVCEACNNVTRARP